MSLTVSGETTGSTDFNDIGGSIAVAEVSARFDASYKLTDTNRLTLGFTAGRLYYDFDGVTGLVPGSPDPFDTIEQIGVDMGVSGLVQKKWFWRVGGLVRSLGEPSADFSETIQYGGMFTLAYQVNPKLSIGGTLLVLTSLEDDVRVIPLPVLNWQLDDDRWSIATSADGVQLHYKSSDELLLRATLLSFSTREYRLSATGPLPGGVVRETRIGLGVGADWKPKPWMTVSGTLGGYVYNNYEVFAVGGADVGDEQTDVPLYLLVAVTVRF